MNAIPRGSLVVSFVVLLQASLALGQAASLQPSGRNVGTTVESDELEEKAFDLVREGKTIEAERLVQSYVDRVAAESGKDSPRYAQALFVLASMRAAYGDFQLGIDALRASCAVKPSDQESRKARLSCLMNLGEFLTHEGQQEEAERVLRSSLAERETFYGKKHAGYAYGAAALAKLLLARGKSEEALRHADDAYQVYWSERHQETPGAIMLRGLALKAAKGLATPALAPLKALQDDAVQEAVMSFQPIGQLVEPAVSLALLDELEGMVAIRPSLRPLDLQVLKMTANLASRASLPTSTVRATQRLVQLLDRPEDAPFKVNALLGLALAQSEVSAPAAEKTYQEALTLAATLHQPGLESDVRRNYGLLLAEKAKPKEADALLKASLENARTGKAKEQIVSSLTAYGIFLQHQKRTKEAQPLLTEAISSASADDANLLFARTHLKALTEKKECDCSNDMPTALSDTVLAMVRPQLPQGLISSVTIQWEGPRPQARVKLSRQVTPEEQRMVDQVLLHAMFKLQHNIRQRGWGRPSAKAK